MVQPQNQFEGLISLTEVSRITCYSRAAIYRFIKNGDFPLPTRLGPNKVCWWESEVLAWRIDRIEKFRLLMTSKQEG